MVEQLAMTRIGYQNLYEELNDAHDDLPGNRPDLRQAARDRRDDVSDILADLDQQDLTTNTAAFAALKCKVDAANEQVRTLQANINKITDCVAIATQIAGVLDKACTAADKLFA